MVILGALLVAIACAAPSPSLAPTSIICGDLAAVDCPDATSAALTAAAGRNGVVVRIELGGGVWCPTPGLLFANTTCPGGALPPAEGGQWIGHALVTFAGSTAQAYINIAKNDQAVRGEFIALATPRPETPSPS